MDENTACQSSSLSPAEDTIVFPSIYHFAFIKKILDHFKDRTKDSINNFLKTVSEIEDEFLNTLKSSAHEKLGNA
jgi:hypothetical protein